MGFQQEDMKRMKDMREGRESRIWLVVIHPLYDFLLEIGARIR
jgi:hypothetical protein